MNGYVSRIFRASCDVRHLYQSSRFRVVCLLALYFLKYGAPA